jgi:flagellar motor switch protein FliN/FliY
MADEPNTSASGNSTAKPDAADTQSASDTSIDDLLSSANATFEPPDSALPGQDAHEAPADGAGDATAPADAASEPAGDEAPDQSAIEELLRQASFEEPAALAGEIADTDLDASADTPDADSFDLPNFSQVIQDAQVSSIDLLRDVELNVKIELGRSRMLVEDVLRLGEGSVVELDKLAGDPVDVFVNDRLVARGEVLVLNDNFCVRVNEIVSGTKEEGL